MNNILRDVASFIRNKKQEFRPGVDVVQYAGPFFDENEYIAATKALLNGWLVLGQCGQEFEEKFPRFLGKKYGVLTNSGSSSNLLMLSAAASKRLHFLPKGSKILTPVAGFPTTINPIIQLGFTPVFVDIELNTLNLDLNKVEEALKKNDIRAVTFAHVLGNPPNLNHLFEMLLKKDIIFLEDCCDALGSTYNGIPLGSFGDFASCSFYPAHHITMGEGGFIACDNPIGDTVLRSLRDWGRGCYCSGKKASQAKNGCCGKRFSDWLPELPGVVTDHKYVYDEIGYNLKPIEIQAAIGLEQIKKLDLIKTLRNRNFYLLRKIFEQYQEFLILPKATENADPSWFAFALTVKDGAPFSKNQIVQFLEDHKIQTRPYFAGNILLQPAYSGIESDSFKKYPNASKVTTDTFFLGTSPVISIEQLSYVAIVVSDFMKQTL